jgi:hypothetical protein
MLKWCLSIVANCKSDAFRALCEHRRVTMRLNENGVLSGEYLVSPLVKVLRY